MPPDARDPRRKLALIAAATALVLIALTALGIPQWAYYEIRSAKNAAQARTLTDESFTATSLPPADQARRRDALLKGNPARGILPAKAPDGGPCNPDLTPLPMSEANAPMFAGMGGPPSEQQCVANSANVSLLPAPPKGSAPR